MGESNFLLALIIGLIVGGGVVFLITLIKKRNLAKSANSESGHENLEASKSEIKKLEEEKQKLKDRLAQNEALLRGFQANDPTSKFAEITKQNQQLNDQIEELEEELKDLDKQNKKIRNEKNGLEEEFDAISKQKQNLEEEAERTKESLKRVSKESEEKNQSLKFINSILNASNSSNKDFEEESRKIYAISSFISEELNRCFQELGDQRHGDLERAAETWKNTELKTWIKGKKVVAIVGEFSAGKTSIVNRILEQDNPNAVKLPTSSKETTAVPTYISKSKGFNCQFYSPDNELRTITKETFEMVTKSVLDQINVSHLIKYFVLSYDNQNLDELSILDTPGFGSNSEDTIKRTTEVVKEAHAIFWVIDANTGDINQTSIDVMKNHLHEMPLYFVINKCDTKSPGDLKLLQQKIISTAESNNIKYKSVISFSKNENAEVLLKHIKELNVSRPPALLSDIKSSLDQAIKNTASENMALTQRIKENRKDVSQSEFAIRNIEDDITYSAKKVNQLVQKKDSFWSEGYYKITKMDYDDFSKCLKDITLFSDQIDIQTDLYINNIKSETDLEKEKIAIKAKLERLNRVQKHFIELVIEYNPNLLN